MSWHVPRVEREEMAYKILVGGTHGKRPLGRPNGKII
jgi:hypothetical protein